MNDGRQRVEVSFSFGIILHSDQKNDRKNYPPDYFDPLFFKVIIVRVIAIVVVIVIEIVSFNVSTYISRIKIVMGICIKQRDQTLIVIVGFS